jgi:NAD(P)H dehydrogenase (quinone)
MSKKILVLVGHPDSESFNKRIADCYADGAREKGHEVKRVNLGDLQFDPILRKGYKIIQELEPDLKQLQEDIKWCEHLVIVYPSWWSTMPSLLKGMFDRIWLPGFAFHFHPHGYWWDGLLKGRTARVFVTSDSHWLLARIIFGDSTNEIKRGILWFAGIKASISKIGGLKHASEAKKSRIAADFKQYGRQVY